MQMRQIPQERLITAYLAVGSMTRASERTVKYLCASPCRAH